MSIDLFPFRYQFRNSKVKTTMKCNVLLAFEFSNLLTLILGRPCLSLEGEQHDELQSDVKCSNKVDSRLSKGFA